MANPFILRAIAIITTVFSFITKNIKCVRNISTLPEHLWHEHEHDCEICCHIRHIKNTIRKLKAHKLLGFSVVFIFNLYSKVLLIFDINSNINKTLIQSRMRMNN